MLQIVSHTCGQFIIRRSPGRYTATADDERPLVACPFCGRPLDDNYLAVRGRRVKKDEDE